MEKRNSIINIIPTWVWVFCSITCFLCLLSYTEGDIYYNTETMSIWESISRNLSKFAYTFEPFYIFAILYSFLFYSEHDGSNKNVSPLNYVISIFQLSIVILLGIYIINCLSYFYSILINDVPFSFSNTWSQSLTPMKLLSPITSGIVLSLLLILRITLSGLMITLISKLFNKGIYFSFIIFCIFLFLFGFESIPVFCKVNILPSQFCSLEHLSLIIGDAVSEIFGVKPVSLGGSITYYAISNMILFAFLVLITNKNWCIRLSFFKKSNMIRSDIIALLLSRKFWIYVILISCVLPFNYYLIWLPNGFENLNSAFAIFYHAFVNSYLMNFIIPLLSVTLLGFSMHSQLLELKSKHLLSSRIYFCKALYASLGTMLLYLFASGVAILISSLISFNGNWDFKYILLYLLYISLIAIVFTLSSFGLLVISNNRTFAVAVPVLYTQYAFGGIYHSLGSKNISEFYGYLPQIIVNCFDGKVIANTNIIAATFASIMILLLGLLKINGGVRVNDN